MKGWERAQASEVQRGPAKPRKAQLGLAAATRISYLFCHAIQNGVSSHSQWAAARIVAFPLGNRDRTLDVSYPAQSGETAIPQGTWRDVWRYLGSA